MPIIILIASIGILYAGSAPLYKEAGEFRAQIAKLDDALLQTRDIVSLRDGLLTKYNAISSEDLEKLEKLLPSEVDNTYLVLEINQLAEKHSMSLFQTSVVPAPKRAEAAQGETVSAHSLRSVAVEFTILGRYESFRRFMEDLEKSLRISDMGSISFDTASILPTGFTTFNVYLEIYKFE